jgi:tetratricopeptide (TPR) repeat protein
MSSRNRKDPYLSFREEILDEAVAICRGEPHGDLTKPRIAHLRGVMALEKGQLDLAIAYLTHSARLDSSSPAVYGDLGEALMRRRDHDKAIAAHLRAVVLSRAVPATLDRLGVALHQAKKPAEAIALLTMAENICPDEGDVHGHLAEVLADTSRLAEAQRKYQDAARLSPDDVAWLLGLGRTRLGLQRPAEALEDFMAALSVAPNHADAHIGVAEACIQLGRFDEAVTALRDALKMNPGSGPAIHKLVFVLELLGRSREVVGAWTALGDLLEGQGRFKEAQAAYARAVGGKSNCLRAVIGLGRVHSSLNEPNLAIRHFEAALTITPSIAAHVGLGQALHAVGDERAWNELAWHHDPASPDWRHVEQPVWTGFELQGRRILLWSDEDVSDALLFIRYAQTAKALGGYVIVECHRKLMPLMRQAVGIDCATPSSGPCVPYDVHAPLRYFPALVRLSHGLQPRVPYLSVPDDLKRTWRARLGKRTGRFIGLSWAGGSSDKGRYIRLSEFKPLADVTEDRLVSLQSVNGRHELLASPPGLVVRELFDDDASMMDLAAVISNLDLVITTDGVVAHLAGSLGKPTWILLPLSILWPWPHEGVNSTYYPSVRLFRQSRPGVWNDVMHEILNRLQAPRQTECGHIGAEKGLGSTSVPAASVER